MSLFRGLALVVVVFLGVILPWTLSSGQPVIISEEKKLIQQLLQSYPIRWGRPVNNMTEKVDVYFGMSLVQILDLDEKNQVLQTNIWTRYQWKDTHLKWDRDEFGGIENIRVPVEGIWTPDIVLYNYADIRLEEKRKVLAIITSDGTVDWRPPSIMISTCSIDIAHFPYDEQECYMKFGSWTYDGFKVDLKFYKNYTGIDLDEYVESNEWEIINAPAIRNEKRYSCCPEPYPDLTFFIRLRRRGGFYNYILVLPCVLLSLLTMLIFWLPPEFSAKSVLGMNLFVSFLVLLLTVGNLIPNASASEVPRLGAYYCINMILIATAVFLCTIIINIYIRDEKKGKVPPLIKKIFLVYLAKFYCMMQEELTRLRQEEQQQQEAEVGCRTSPVPSRRIERAEKFAILKERFEKQRTPASFEDKASASPAASAIEARSMALVNSVHNNVKEIRDYLRHTRKRIETTDAKSKVANEWRMVALVLDRTFFFIYVIAMLIALIMMFPRPASSALH